MFVYCLWIEVLTIDIHSDVDGSSFVFYLGFVKFYRHHTLENLMSITVDPNLRENL